MDGECVTNVAAANVEEPNSGLQLLPDGQVLALRRPGNGLNQCPRVVCSGNGQLMKKLFSIDEGQPVVARSPQVGTCKNCENTGA